MERLVALLLTVIFVCAFTACDEKSIEKNKKAITAEIGKTVSKNAQKNADKDENKSKKTASKKNKGGSEKAPSENTEKNAEKSGNGTANAPKKSDIKQNKKQNNTAKNADGNTFDTKPKKSVTTTTSVDDWDYDDLDDAYDTDSDDYDEDKNETDKNETKGDNHEHSYIKNVAEPTCGASGYTRYSCNCGHSYVTDKTPPTGNHEFLNMGNAYFKCKMCGTKVVDYGNADGSYGKKCNVKYYITSPDCEHYTDNDDCEIVIYGTGDMPNFSKTNLPPWYDALIHTAKIRIESGITSIGTWCFYQPNIRGKVVFSIADSVTTIKYNAINMPMNYFVVGKGVQRIENGIFGTEVMYWPESLKYYGRTFSGTVIFYGGDKDSFLAIKVPYYSQAVTIKTFFEKHYGHDVYSQYNHTYLTADGINDTDVYYNSYKDFKV